VLIPNEAAALLSMGVATVRKLMENKHLPFMMVGSDYKIWMDDLKNLREKLLYKKLDLKTGELIDIDHRDVKTGVEISPEEIKRQQKELEG